MVLVYLGEVIEDVNFDITSEEKRLKEQKTAARKGLGNSVSFLKSPDRFFIGEDKKQV